MAELGRRKVNITQMHVRENYGVGKASWFGAPLRSIIKLDPLSFRIFAQASQLCSISIKSFEVTSITCSCRTARATRDFLQQHNIRIMLWPVLSPGLNPIEHLWDEIQRKLTKSKENSMKRDQGR